MCFLDELAALPLTLIVAPAGTGKTALAAAWTAESTAPVAWLSLEEADHSATTFWTSALAALETVAPGCGAQATVRLRAGASHEDLVGDLLDDLDSVSAPTSHLIIDDLHLADTASIRRSFALFARHLPEWLHVLAISRHELDLPLERLRSLGRVGEIRRRPASTKHAAIGPTGGRLTSAARV
jgi:LuxR family maltose regulon positive regulatory protein